MNRPPEAIATVVQLDRPRGVGFNRANLGRARSGLSGNRQQVGRSDECSQTGAQELSSSVAEERMPSRMSKRSSNPAVRSARSEWPLSARPRRSIPSTVALLRQADRHQECRIIGLERLTLADSLLRE